MQGKPALNRCTTRMSCRWGVASTCISLRCILYMLHIMYIYIYLCIAYISSHSKGPEQDQLRSPFVPYVRNTAERSIHNFDSGPDVASLRYTTLITLHYTPLHYTPLHYITQHYNYTTTRHYTKLHDTTLHYTPLHYTTFHHTALPSTTLHSTTLRLRLHNYTPLHSTTLNYTTLHYTTLHSTTLHYTTLHYTRLHYTEWHCTTDRQVDRQIDR